MNQSGQRGESKQQLLHLTADLLVIHETVVHGQVFVSDPRGSDLFQSQKTFFLLLRLLGEGQ